MGEKHVKRVAGLAGPLQNVWHAENAR